MEIPLHHFFSSRTDPRTLDVLTRGPLGPYLKAYSERLTDDLLLPYGSGNAFKKENLAQLPAESLADRASVIHRTDQLRNALVGVLVQADN